MKSSIDIYSYTNFRFFLRDALANLKEQDSKFSQRYISQKLGLKSSGWLADVIAGRKNLSMETLRNLSEFLELNQREKAFFETLVFYSQAESNEEKHRHYEHLLTFREVSADLLAKDRFDYFSAWHHMVLREWMLVEPFQGQTEKLAQITLPPISPDQAKSSIELLNKLGMLEKHAGGKQMPTSVHVKKQSDFDRMHYLSHMRTSIQHGLWALENIPKTERDMSTMMGALSDSSFKEICEDIAALRRKIATLSEKECRERRITRSTAPMRVYQFVFQGYPMTQNEAEVK